jgi:perosamine synthetase|tara:strand:+ start:2487 stop:3632 length:1146 start_codon:yes stop_codon:yes gene_type:complete
MIPLSVPNLTGNEEKYVKKCLDTGWVSTAGEFVNKFEKSFANKIKMKDAVSVMNGTSALHMAMMQITNKEDIVILPNLSFVATANAAMYLGIEPVFIDIDEDDWQMDLDLLEEFLSEECISERNITKYKKNNKKIAAIVIVHNQGNMCDMDRLKSISKKFNVSLIEDAAESLGSKYKGKDSGTFGEFGCFSFNGNKIITTGGGGMIVSKNKKMLNNIKHISTTAKVDPIKYFHDEVGYNYRLVNILAAIGLAQLENLELFISSKRKTADFYREALNDIGDIRFQKIHSDVKSNEWLFTIRTNQSADLMNYLNKKGIMSRPFWMPMNMLPMYSNKIFFNKENKSRSVHESCITLPCSTNITEAELNKVAEEIRNFYSDAKNF